MTLCRVIGPFGLTVISTISFNNGIHFLFCSWCTLWLQFKISLTTLVHLFTYNLQIMLSKPRPGQLFSQVKLFSNKLVSYFGLSYFNFLIILFAEVAIANEIKLASHNLGLDGSKTLNPGDRIHIPCPLMSPGGSVQWVLNNKPILLVSVHQSSQPRVSVWAE